MKRVFRNGNDIRIFQDLWIPVMPPRPPKPKEDVFIEVKPTLIMPTVKYIWALNSNGAYNVKSGYWAWSEWLRRKDKEEIGIMQPSIQLILELVWKTNTDPKVQHFLWKCLTNSLPTLNNLAKKRLTTHTQCPRCGAQEETINHILFAYPYARLVWALTPLAGLFYPTPSDSVFVNIFSCLKVPEEGTAEWIQHFILAPWILWEIWKASNTLSFNAEDEEAQLTLDRAMRNARDWQQAQELVAPKLVSSPSMCNVKRRPPP